MLLTEIAKIRLISQQIEGGQLKTVKDIVGWMGGMQAQDYAMAKWAIGLRLPSSTDLAIETAINDGDIIRTHLLRPTWHFVSADDVHWMLEITAPQIRAILKSRHKQLGLSETIFTKSNSIIEHALGGGKHLTREQLLAELGKAKIALNENRASHLFLGAELAGIICNGPTIGGKQTYALLEERVSRTKPLNKDEALGMLAKKYFISRGPATLKDFVWWSGLSVSQARQALDIAGSELISETINSHIYWFNDFNAGQRIDQEAVYLLPAYDEFLIGYEDRQVSLPLEDLNKTVSNNGIFRPVIVVNGQVTGTWKRTFRNGKVIVELVFYNQPDKTTMSLVENASLRYGHFLGKEIVINSLMGSLS